MKRNYHLFFVFVLILLLPFFSSKPTRSGLDTTEKTNYDQHLNPLQIVSEPNETVSLPFIVTADTQIALGNDILYFYGMKDEGGIFYDGYNYSIYLIDGINSFFTNDTSILSNFTLIDQGITKGFGQDKIKFIENTNLISSNTQNYTLLFLVNSTYRGLLNSTSRFEIIVPPGASVNVFFLSQNNIEIDEDNIIDLEVNQTAELSIILKNLGSTNAFSITLEIVDINQPIGIANDTLPAEVTVISPLEEVIFNFTVTPPKFGIGVISFKLLYTDGLGSLERFFPKLIVHALPNLDGNIQGRSQVEFNENEDIIFSVSLEYNGPLSLDAFNDLSIWVQLSSNKVTILPQEIQFTPNVRLYHFNAKPDAPGVVDISLTVRIFDNDGFDTTTLLITQSEIEFISGSIPVSEGTNFSDYFPIIAIILYFILILVLAILYYREDIRTKFFTQVLGLQILESIDYQTTSVIIDGSNIAWEQTNPGRKPMINNIIRAYKVLKENSFKKIVIIADAALRYQIDDRDELDRLVKSEFIKLVPAKVNADGFILRFSAENGYLILSNDLYKEFRDTYSWIDERRVPYTILDDRFYLHPTFE